jgi:predicted ester cyclase
MARVAYWITGGVALLVGVASAIVLFERRAGRGEPADGDAAGPAGALSTTLPTHLDPALRFGQELTRATAARAPKAIADLYRPDATITMGGRSANREDLEKSFVDIFGQYRDVQYTIGRVWRCDDASIVEFAYSAVAGPGAMRLVEVNGDKPVRAPGMDFSGTRVGVMGAFVLRFDGQGIVRTESQYLDTTTYGGQMAPNLLPAWARVRPAVIAPPFGTDSCESRGTAEAGKNLAAERALFAVATQHDAEGFVRLLTPHHVYDDYRAGGPMDNASLQSNMGAIFAAFPDWKIDTPMQCAAGDYVITQLDESGTWQGQFLERAPTNKAFKSSTLFIHQFQEGVPVHAYVYGDSDGPLRQIGFWKEAGPATSSGTTGSGRLVPTTSAGY